MIDRFLWLNYSLCVQGSWGETHQPLMIFSAAHTSRLARRRGGNGEMQHLEASAEIASANEHVPNEVYGWRVAKLLYRYLATDDGTRSKLSTPTVCECLCDVTARAFTQNDAQPRATRRGNAAAARAVRSRLSPCGQRRSRPSPTMWIRRARIAQRLSDLEWWNAKTLRLASKRKLSAPSNLGRSGV